jgi:phosphoglycerol transferase
MKQALQTLRQHPIAAGLLPLLLACFLYLFFRNSGVYPIIFIDEWSYASNARLQPLKDAIVPSYLYFLLYGATSYCGDGWLECNRLLNELLYVGAAPFIYLLARRVARPLVAGLVALAAVLAPANALTAYFMPEAAYFFAFWLVCWASMWTYDLPTWRRAALLGAVLALAAMVKAHAIFLLPGAVVFMAYLAWSNPGAGNRLRQAAVLVAALGACFALVRFGLGYAMAGKNGLYLLGKVYADQAKYVGKQHAPLADLAWLTLNNLRGQMMMLALLFGVPLAALAAQLAALREPSLRRKPEQALAVLCLLMLGSAIAVTVLFTASITGLGAGETVSRIHTRYYHFALPLLMLCAAAALRDTARPALWLRAMLGVALLALVAHGWHDMLRLFTPNITDSPELRTVSFYPKVFAALAALAAASIACWIAWPRQGARAFMFGFLPVSTLLLALVTGQLVRATIYPDDYSKAGQFVRHYLHPGQAGRLTIVAEDIGAMWRAKFFIQNMETDFLQTPSGQPVAWDKLAPGKTWALVMGQYELPADAVVIARKDSFALIQTGIRSAADALIKFNEPLPATFVQRVDGLAGAEEWGSWTDGPGARIQFARPLPSRFKVQLSARAFGPNAEKDFLLKIGGQQHAFRIGKLSTSVELEFAPGGAPDTMEFVVPAPVSPHSLGLSPDLRQIGLGLETMKVVPLP